MERLFCPSLKRRRIPLDGQWHITYDPQNQGRSLGYPDGRGRSGDFIYVPSCWNLDFKRFDYMGAAWYSRTFITPAPGNYRLIFHAVSGEAEVYLDGRELGSHYGSYTRFQFDIPQLPAGEHSLVVKVDNTVNNEDTLPLKFVDWFVWGGIYRGVELEQFDGLSIDNMNIAAEWNEGNVAKIIVDARIKNWTNRDISDTFILDIASKEIASQKTMIPAGAVQNFRFTLTDFQPTLWDTENPYLYEFHLTCGSDDLYERTGFRKIERIKDKILLNGKEIFYQRR